MLVGYLGYLDRVVDPPLDVGRHDSEFWFRDRSKGGFLKIRFLFVGVEHYFAKFDDDLVCIFKRPNNRFSSYFFGVALEVIAQVYTNF